MSKKESALPEAATSEQSKSNDVTLQEDLSITELVMQVLRPTMEAIELLGGSEDYISISLSDCGLRIYEGHYLMKNGETKLTGHIELVDAHVNAERWGKAAVVDSLKNAAHTMNGVLERVRKEHGHGKD